MTTPGHGTAMHAPHSHAHPREGNAEVRPHVARHRHANGALRRICAAGFAPGHSGGSPGAPAADFAPAGDSARRCCLAYGPVRTMPSCGSDAAPSRARSACRTWAFTFAGVPGEDPRRIRCVLWAFLLFPYRDYDTLRVHMHDIFGGCISSSVVHL